MKLSFSYYVLLCLVAFISCSLHAKELDPKNELSVTDESLPELPDPPKKQKKREVVPSINGIVLVNSDECLLLEKNLSRLKGVEIVGYRPPGNPLTLKEKLNPFLRQKLTEETLQEIKRTISNYYRSVGHPFVVVQAPEQDVSGGTLLLLVLESRVGEVKVKGNKWTSSEHLREYFRLRPDQVINEGHLMNDVHFVNRNPFRRINVIYAPGTEPGTTDVILNAEEQRSFRVYTGVDNTGVDPVGRGRYRVGFNWGNAFGLDHIMAYQYTMALDIKRFYAHTGEYIAPLPWKHILDIFGGYSHVEPKKTAAIRKNTGWSMQVSMRYTVPLKVHQHFEHEISGGFDFKRTNNTFEFSDAFPLFGNNVNLTQFLFSYTGTYDRRSFRLDYDGHVYYSPGKWLADQTNSNYDSLRPGAKNHWVYFRGSFAYLQRLPKSFSLSLIGRGQISSQNLLPSEQFGLGGYDTVRGYEQRELNKDGAILLTMEGRSPSINILKNKRDALQLLLFIDYGWGNDHNALPMGKKAEYLLGAGPGIRYSIAPYLNARLDWGIKLHKKALYGGGNSMIHFGLTAAF